MDNHLDTLPDHLLAHVISLKDHYRLRLSHTHSTVVYPSTICSARVTHRYSDHQDKKQLRVQDHLHGGKPTTQGSPAKYGKHLGNRTPPQNLIHPSTHVMKCRSNPNRRVTTTKNRSIKGPNLPDCTGLSGPDWTLHTTPPYTSSQTI